MTAPSTCSDPTCGKPAKALGLCATHYQRQRRGGEPGPIQEHWPVPNAARRCLYMDGLHWQRLGELAETRGASASELVRQAVARWLAELDLQVAQVARDEAVQAVLHVPLDAPAEAKRVALERAKVAREALLEAEQALRAAGGRP